jgi:7-carboxy-7-deazaguanine synthase
MPCTFIRLAGCPLSCSYCDTPQALAIDSGSLMAVDDIVQEVTSRKRPLVLVTGGEPLAQRNCFALLQALESLDCEVQLETSGAFSIASVPANIRRIVDIKTPDSGEAGRNQLKNIPLLHAGDEVKFVLCSRQDYKWSRDFIAEHQLVRQGCDILFSPAWELLSAADLSQWILQDQLPVRMQIQLHKVIWGAEATGV